MKPVFIFLALIVGACNDSDTVENETDTTIVRDAVRGQWLSMSAIGNQPVASYYDGTSGALEFAIGTLNDGVVTWKYEMVAGYADSSGLDSGDMGKYTSLAVSADSTVWISFYDMTGKSLRYAKREIKLQDPVKNDGPIKFVWTEGLAATGSGSTPDAGKWSSLALDPSGIPVIAYQDVGKGKLGVVRWNDGSFGGGIDIEGEDYTDESGTTPANVGSFAKLIIDSEGVEYIAYYDATWGALRLAVGGADGYTVYTVDDDGDVGQWPSMIVKDGVLHIAYHDVGNQDLKYAVGQPGSFNIEVVDDGDLVGADSEIFINGDFPSIVYFSGSKNDVKLATKTGGSWSVETFAGDNAALGFHNEIISINGQNYLGCYDYTNKNIWFNKVE